VAWAGVAIGDDEPVDEEPRSGDRNRRNGAGARSGRGSPPTARVTRVLAELARSSPQPVGLTQLARQLELAPSTCLGILNELVDADFVVRHAVGPRYSLGPALVTLGRTAQRSQPAIGLATEQATALAASLGRVCTVATVERDEIVVLARAGRTTGIQPYVEAGSRFPFFAPIGVMFAAWDTDASVAAWLGRSPVVFDEARLERLRRVIASCRQQGWLVERLTDVERTLHQVLPAAVGNARDAEVRPIIAQAAALFTERDYILGELPDDGTCSVSVVCAPTFDVDGLPDLIVSVYMMEDDTPGDQVRGIAEQLRRGADAVTGAVGGRDPWRSSPPTA
jgi:DNA-binding IclR family transcriptional regulator